MKLNAPAVDIGITENLWKSEKDRWGIDLREGLVYLGQTSINAKVPSHHTNTTSGHWVDPDFVGAKPDPCSGTCNDLSTFDGSGHEIGATITLQPYWKSRDDIKISLIGGVFLHRTTFNEHVTHLDWSSTSPFYDTDVSTNTGIRFGSVWGVAAQKGHMVVKYQYFSTPGNLAGNYPPPWHGIHMVTIGWSF
jgi:hypothetical protein